jgi:riboflavin kinase/FMN adenylyltransferase
MLQIRLDSPARFDWPSPAVTVGNFDGVHRGHQALLAAAEEEAARAKGTVVVLTFEPHPLRVIDPDRAPSTLMTFDQKAEVLASLGVEVLAVLPFTPARAAQPPDEFAREVLAGALAARAVVVGEGFRFGRGRAGDVALLRRVGAERGFVVRPVPPVLHRGAPISSSRIRDALAEGRVEVARALLGRPFFLDGLVVRGEGRGRTLGIPTANLDVVNETLPARGVYAAWVRRLDAQPSERWPAVANLGRRPTFSGENTTVEAHVLDRQDDLYGARLRLEFALRLRDERAFAGPQALVEQIRRDIDAARPVLDERGGRTL